MTLADVVLDPASVRALIAEGETLFVERKQAIPAAGLAPTVASFANTLGGWILLGVANDGEVVGYEWDGRADLQDHIREHLRGAIDPLPPFAAVEVPVDGKSVGVIRVAESVDTPHVVSVTGALVVRLPGGKAPVGDHRMLLEMARRGEEARDRAARHLYGLPLVEAEMGAYDPLPGAAEASAAEGLTLMHWIVRARPLTVPAVFSDRALQQATGQAAAERMSQLVPRDPRASGHAGGSYQARARGVYAAALGVIPTAQRADVVIDAGGVVAARLTLRRDRGIQGLDALSHSVVRPLLRAVAETLEGLDALGRALTSLEVHGGAGMTVSVDGGGQQMGVLDADALLRLGGNSNFRADGDLALPADGGETAELAERWMRELGRAAGIALFEPGNAGT